MTTRTTCPDRRRWTPWRRKVSKPKIGSRSSWGAKAYNGSPDYASGIKQAVVLPHLRLEQLLGCRRSGNHPRYPGLPPSRAAAGTTSGTTSSQTSTDVSGTPAAVTSRRPSSAPTSPDTTPEPSASPCWAPTTAQPRRGPRCRRLGDRLEVLAQRDLKASSSNMVGHRDLGQTDCPGDAFYAKMGEMRSTVNSILKTRSRTAQRRQGRQEGRRQEDREAEAEDLDREICREAQAQQGSRQGIQASRASRAPRPRSSRRAPSTGQRRPVPTTCPERSLAY